MFARDSRYAGVPTHEHTLPDGQVVRYVGVRPIPPVTAIQGYRVIRGDRLDRIADDVYRSPERFWRICDANRALWPDDLVAESGRILVIPPAAAGPPPRRSGGPAGGAGR
ncbi:hypothetical protein [Frankia sp. CiP1_Cm_nod2]|uniref:hypothetical protein n=1 Tax=Frankia sp. CiP1_Cm_nod2 TaxID=2897161 RepID=UPI002024ABD7